MNEGLVVYVVSDSIGETGDQVIKAATSQFSDKNLEIRRFPYITEEDQIVEIIQEAKNQKSLIALTMVIPSLRNKIFEEAKKYNIMIVDIMTPVIESLSSILNESPRNEPGLIRKLDEKYFKKVEAIEFAVKYDDGKDPRGLKDRKSVV